MADIYTAVVSFLALILLIYGIVKRRATSQLRSWTWNFVAFASQILHGYVELVREFALLATQKPSRFRQESGAARRS